ncbi:MAG: FHA domain-containing protein [Acidobacteria bacterium]|nr:FHA domain-containing protein [Acidobacteriota bacterium]
MWILRTLAGPDDGPATFRLLPGSMKTLGRAIRADFVLDAPLVSRVHCRLTCSETDRLEVEDLRSTNGTFVNNRRIQRAVLITGDRVRVGRVEFEVAHDGAPVVAEATEE